MPTRRSASTTYIETLDFGVGARMLDEPLGELEVAAITRHEQPRQTLSQWSPHRQQQAKRSEAMGEREMEGKTE